MTVNMYCVSRKYQAPPKMTVGEQLGFISYKDADGNLVQLEGLLTVDSVDDEFVNLHYVSKAGAPADLSIRLADITGLIGTRNDVKEG